MNEICDVKWTKRHFLWKAENPRDSTFERVSVTLQTYRRVIFIVFICCFRQKDVLEWRHVSAIFPTIFAALFWYIKAETKWPPLCRRYFQIIFFNENVWISTKISPECVPKGLIDNKSALVPIMVWRPKGDNPLPELMMTQFTDAFMRHPVSMS